MDSSLDDVEFGNAFLVCYCTSKTSFIQFMLDKHFGRVWLVLYIRPYMYVSPYGIYSRLIKTRSVSTSGNVV